MDERTIGEGDSKGRVGLLTGSCKCRRAVKVNQKPQEEEDPSALNRCLVEALFRRSRLAQLLIMTLMLFSAAFCSSWISMLDLLSRLI